MTCGSCWAFSVIAMLESYYAIKSSSGTFVNLSEQYLVDCDPYNMACEGGNTLLALWFLKNAKGLYSESEYPYLGKKGNCTRKYPIRNLGLPSLNSSMPFERIKSTI